MTRFLLLAALFVLTGSYAAADTLTILHIGDTHSRLAPGGRRTVALEGTTGGIARAVSAIGMMKMTESNALALHAGDIFIGDLFFNAYFGVPELRILAALGLDAMTLGNHEFDLTPAVLETALDSGFVAGGFPVLSANAVFPDTGFASLRRHVSGLTVKEVGDVRVGIFGLTTPSTNLLSLPAPIVIDDRIVEIASAMVDSLRERNCDVVILLSHLGVALDTVVAASVEGIDVVIGGHDHYSFAEPILVKSPSGDPTTVAQAGAFYSNVGRMRLSVGDGVVDLIDYALVPLDASVPEHAETKAVVDELIAGIEATYGPVYSQQIAYAEHDHAEVPPTLMTSGCKDTPVGNLVADALRAAMGTDIAIEPGGSTAEKLYQGPLVAADAYRAISYGFNTVNGLGYRVATL